MKLLDDLRKIKRGLADIEHYHKQIDALNKKVDELQKASGIEQRQANKIISILNQDTPTLKRWIEITTKIGCSNNCLYCPQKTLVSSYFAEQSDRKREMALEDFKLALKHIPKWLDIDFAGMNEPFENPEAFDMLTYASKSGYKTHVFTTLKALSIAQIKALPNLGVLNHVIHLPDKDGMMHLNIDEEYIEKLLVFSRLKMKNTRYVCIGNVHPQIPEEIRQKVAGNKEVILRAGTLENADKLPEGLNLHPACGRVIDTTIPVLCRKRLRYAGEDRDITHVENTVLLPDGSLQLCCNDYGLQHTLGNLFEQNYEAIMHGPAMRAIEDSMMCKNQDDILCRNCELAYTYEQYRQGLIDDEEI